MKDGVLVVDKPTGYTSHDVVNLARRAFNTKKIGHIGTLDPEATGVLVLCVGEATKLVSYAMKASKTYMATMFLGAKTDTYDRTGEITFVSDVRIENTSIYKVMESFVGKQDQIPPMYSAIKIKGKKLYEFAREGKVVERQARQIYIENIDNINIQWPFVSFRVVCSSGTYIRSLIHDMGEALGSGAYMNALRRTRVGSFTIDEAINIVELKNEDIEFLLDQLKPADSLVMHLPKLSVNSDELTDLLKGRWLLAENEMVPGVHRLYSDEEFYGLAEDIWRNDQRFVKLKRGWNRNKL